jgi:type II secretory pathway component PulF
MGLKQVEDFCHRMAVGFDAGIDLPRMLDAEARLGSPRHRTVAHEMLRSIRSGASLSQAMDQAGHYFPRLLRQMVSAGETAGGLERTLAHLADYYRDLRLARRDFLSRLSWPAAQLGLALLVISGTILLQGWLMPSAGEHSYDASGLGLRGAAGLITFWFWVLTVVGLIAGSLVGLWKNALNCHRWAMPMLLKLPVLGTVLVSTAMSRLAMVLAMMLNAGVDAGRAVKEALKATGNHYYTQGIPVALAQVELGKSLAESLEAPGLLPTSFIEDLAVGELSGTETQSLERVAADYHQRAKAALSQLAFVASFGCYLLIILALVAMILRMAMNYVNMLNGFMP